jgi:acyl-CoA synthetase (AMP-forming)/AMP-acid ligase II
MRVDVGITRPQDIPDLLANAVSRFPGRPCVICGDRSLSFAETDDRAARLAEAFVRAGLAAGDRVALLAHNELEYLEIQVAAQRAGMILVPLNFRLAVTELTAQLRDCTPELLIHGPGFEAMAAQLEVPRVWHLGPDGRGSRYEDALAPRESGGPPPVLDGQAVCTILYTSGTTGRAKGAMVTNRALLASLSLTAFEVSVHPGDTLLFPMPLFHVAAHLAYAFTYRGGTLVLMRGYDAGGVIELLERHRVSHSVLVPTMIGDVVEALDAGSARLDALRLLVYGGSPISPELLRRALAAFGCRFQQGYGLTEAFNATILRPDDHDPDGRPDLLASAGRDALSYRVAVADPSCRELPAGELGEIVIRGPAVMAGYWNAPEATAEVLRGGWLHTGDLGYRSEEGFVYLTDRLKDVIVSGGENVYSREVEDVLAAHPAVLEAAVIGIPSPRWGESVHGVVVLRSGREVGAEELIAHCRDHLAGYKSPKTVELIGAMPKNASGKILKRDLREPYWKRNGRAIG